MRGAVILIALLVAAPAFAQDKPTTKVDTAELVILRARVDVLTDALTAAQAQIAVLTAQVREVSTIADRQFTATRQRWEPQLLAAHGHANDGWTWDWDAWQPRAPEPKPAPEPKK